MYWEKLATNATSCIAQAKCDTQCIIDSHAKKAFEYLSGFAGNCHAAGLIISGFLRKRRFYKTIALMPRLEQIHANE